MEEDFIPELVISEDIQSQLIDRPQDEHIRKLQDESLQKMEAVGIISINRTDEGEISSVIVDPIIFTGSHIETNSGDRYLKDVVKNSAAGLINNGVCRRNSRESLFWTFKGIPVVSQKEQASALTEQRDPIARNLFYVPSKDDVFDVQAMKRDENSYYLTQWSVGQRVNWDSSLAVREEGFNSGITLLETAVPYEIYISGKGSRDAEGILWVDKNPKDPSEGRQKISGKWFANHFFAGGGKGVDATWDNPKSFVSEHGDQWNLHGLLNENDFPTRNSEKEVYQVTYDGMVYINNRRFSLGSEFQNSAVKRISPNEYGVYGSEAEPLVVFKDEIKKESIRNCTLVTDESSNRHLISIPLGAYPSSLNQEYGMVTITRFQNGEKKKEHLSYRREIPEVDVLKTKLSGESLFAFENISVEDQIFVNRQLNELDAEQRGKAISLIEKGGEGYVKLISDIYKEGSFDTRILDMDGESPEKIAETFKLYTQYRESSFLFLEKMKEALVEKNNQVNQIFLERIN